MADKLSMDYVESAYVTAWCGSGRLPKVDSTKIDAAVTSFRQQFGSIRGVGKPKKSNVGFTVSVTEKASEKLPDEFEGFLGQLVAD